MAPVSRSRPSKPATSPPWSQAPTTTRTTSSEVTDGAFHRSSVGRSAEELGDGTYRVALNGVVSVPAAVEYFNGRREVEFAQPDYTVTVAKTPNDPSYASEWGLNNSSTTTADIGAPEAWNTGTGTGQTIVAVIDSGIDYNHPDLRANMWVNTREIAGNGKDDDGNGYRDDVYGYDFANKDANPMDDNGHGTHVAGTIGAVGNNGIGVTGVAWKTRMMAVKFLDENGTGYMSDAVKALNYAVANGSKIVNNSWWDNTADPAMESAIANARARGVIFVAAAGNDGTNNDTRAAYPANYAGNNVVAVAATDRSDRLAGFSNYGRTTVDIAAPGQGIYSTLPRNKYGTYSGTSMAAPHVAGALAVVWDAHPNWSYRQVIDAVLNSADRVSTLSGKVATGRLNVGKAITYSTTTPTDTGARRFQRGIHHHRRGPDEGPCHVLRGDRPGLVHPCRHDLDGTDGKTIALSAVSVGGVRPEAVRRVIQKPGRGGHLRTDRRPGHQGRGREPNGECGLEGREHVGRDGSENGRLRGRREVDSGLFDGHFDAHPDRPGDHPRPDGHGGYHAHLREGSAAYARRPRRDAGEARRRPRGEREQLQRYGLQRHRDRWHRPGCGPVRRDLPARGQPVRVRGQKCAGDVAARGGGPGDTTQAGSMGGH